MVDFRRSLPPLARGVQEELARTLERLAGEMDLNALMRESRARINEREQRAAVRFLSPRLGADVSAERIIASNGTQSALVLLLRELVGSSGVLLAETLTYGSLRPLAEKLGVRVEGVAIDEEGLLPDAFERACRELHPKALYCNPTVHNPTTAIMSLPRRWTLIEIARKHGVAIIEDEALGRLYPDLPQPLATLAPEICWYLMSATKCLSHGLRVAYTVAPSAQSANLLLESAEQLSFWVPTPVSLALMTDWLERSAADRVTGQIAEECKRRQKLASQVFADFQLRAPDSAMHVWLSLPNGLRADEFAERAQKSGVLLRPAARFAVDDRPTPDCVRLSLSTPANLAEVDEGLHTLKDLLIRGG